MNKTIYLIPCCKDKLSFEAPARELYISTGFKIRLAYAESQHPDAIFVLSGKYHLVPLTKKIEPYDLNLGDQSDEYKAAWAKRVLEDLSLVSDLKEDRYVILCDEPYYEGLVPSMERFEIPLAGLNHQERLKFLRCNTEINNQFSETSNTNQFPSVTAMAHQAKSRMLTTGDDTFMKKIIEVYPTDGMVHYLYAEALEQKEQFVEAAEEYESASRYFPFTRWQEMARVGLKRVLSSLK